MFDLLGLPVCNTGLSLFTIWSEESVETYDTTQDGFSTHSTSFSIDSCDEEDTSSINKHRTKSAPHTAVTIVTVANRWRRRQQLPKPEIKKVCKKSAINSRKVSPSNQPVSSNKNPRPKSLQTKNKGNVSKIGAFLPTVNIGEEYNCIPHSDPWIQDGTAGNKRQNRINVRKTQEQPSALWGNGRDWRNPPACEGDWVCVYPLGKKNNFGEEKFSSEPHTTMFGDKEIKTVVMDMNKCSKVAKDIFKKNCSLSDEARNNLLIKNLGISGLIWMPNN